MTAEDLTSHRIIDRRKALMAGTTLVAASAIGAATPLRNAKAQQQPATLAPSPSWTRALPAGPDRRVKITETYAALVARDAYFWAWPMVNVYNRRLAQDARARACRPGAVGAAQPSWMLTDYVDPEERIVACPNQDVVYGGARWACHRWSSRCRISADRFWVYQTVDVRTDSFVQLGKMYGTQPGFYLLVGPGWQGATFQRASSAAFHSPTNTGFVAPRVFHGRHGRRQAGDPAAATPDHDVSARRI